MTFLILTPYSDDEDEFPIVIAETDDVDAIPQALAAAHAIHGDVFLAERLTFDKSPRSAIPGELTRAIDAWNAMPKGIPVPRIGSNRARFLPPYRRWKKEVGPRDYLLEALVVDVEATPFCWPWIHFGWLFGKKEGTFNSEKLHRGQWKTLGQPKRERTADEIAGFPQQDGV